MKWLTAGIFIALGIAVLSSLVRTGGELTLLFVTFESASSDNVDPLAAFSQANLMKLPTELRRHLCGPPFASVSGSSDGLVLPSKPGITLLLCGAVKNGDWLQEPKEVIESAAGARVESFSYTIFSDDHGCEAPNAKFAAAVGQWMDALGLRPSWNLALHMWNTGTAANPPPMATAGSKGARDWICPGYFWPLTAALSDGGNFQVLYAGPVRESSMGLTYVVVRGLAEKTKSPGNNGTIYKDVTGQYYAELSPLN